MFNKPESIYNPPAPMIDYTESFKTLTQHVCDLKQTVQVEMKKMNLQGAPVDLVISTISPAGMDIEMQGYKYFGIIVGSAQTLNVNAKNVTYPVDIVAGFNQVRLFDGFTISCDNTVPCVIIRSSYLFN